MKTRAIITAAWAALLLTALPTSSDSLLSGTWCVGRDGLVITFIGKDSIHVTSMSDESVDGWGTYTKKGSNLTATLTNDELELTMGYRYQVREDSTIRAKILFFTVDGDSVNHPRRWLRMVKCNPEKGDIPDELDEELTDDDDAEAGQPEASPSAAPTSAGTNNKKKDTAEKADTKKK